MNPIAWVYSIIYGFPVESWDDHPPIQGVDHPDHPLTCFSSPTPQVSYAQLCRRDAQKSGWPIQEVVEPQSQQMLSMFGQVQIKKRSYLKQKHLRKILERNRCVFTNSLGEICVFTEVNIYFEFWLRQDVYFLTGIYPVYTPPHATFPQEIRRPHLPLRSTRRVHLVPPNEPEKKPRLYSLHIGWWNRFSSF